MMHPIHRLILFALALGFSSPLVAQEAEPEALAPLVVTAQKSVQPLVAVPVTMQAFTGDWLAAAGVERYQDLAQLTPGVFLQEQSPNNPTFNIRGLNSESSDPRLESRVSVFQDGVSISRMAASVTELFDLERVEILKGPQGTLFGRAAESGALSIVQRKPTPGRSGSLALGWGDFAEFRLAGHLNAPLTANEHWLGRVALVAVQREGTVANLIDGSTLNGRDTIAVRPSLRWQPHAGTTLDVVVNAQRDRPPGVAFKSMVVPTSRGDTDPFSAAELTRGAALGVDRTVWGVTALLDHALAANWQLTAISGWRAYDSYEDYDADGSRHFLLELSDDGRGHQFSQEVRVGTTGEHGLRAFVGASYFREWGEQRNVLTSNERIAWPYYSGNFRNGVIAAGVPAALAQAAVPVMAPFVEQPTLPATFALFAAVPPLAGLASLAGAPLKTRQTEEFFNEGRSDAYEVFADASREVWPRLELTLGARVSREKQTLGYEATPSATPSALGFLLGAAPNFAFKPTVGRREAARADTARVGRALLRYEVAKTVSIYGGVARGRRPATLIPDATQTTPVREESVVNFELGAKWQPAGGRVAAEAALFRYDYRHFQTVTADPTNPSRFLVRDAGAATGQGGEITARGWIGGGVQAFVNYGYTDARFDETADDGQVQRYAGSQLRLTARHTVGAGLQGRHSLAGRGQLGWMARWHYRARHYFDDDNTRFGGTLVQPGFGVVGLRGTWITPGNRWEIAAQVDNLLDRAYLIDAGNLGANYGLPTTVRGESRTAHVSVTRRW